jgi:hypothetical protein
MRSGMPVSRVKFDRMICGTHLQKMLIASGTDVGTVAALMGHTTPTMVLTHYQHVLTKQKKLAVSTLLVFSCAQTMCTSQARNGEIL